jgi:uncharacterized protein YbbC (DUF1343 family)
LGSGFQKPPVPLLKKPEKLIATFCHTFRANVYFRGVIQGIFFVIVSFLCSFPPKVTNTIDSAQELPSIVCGAEKLDSLLVLLKGKTFALVSNHTTMVGKVHLVDTLISIGLKPEKIFAPEHGFRGTEEAGQDVASYIDIKTGIEVVSLYGKNQKPTAETLKKIQWMIFDIQDVGARFYTYISTLHYVMEACAENKIPLLVLDRPNPNGFYVDGPVLEPEFKSFVGMHPVPVVHGMTIAEYAQMINGEGWLKDGQKCQLSVIKTENYKHQSYYRLPIPPSPNLRSRAAIFLYPSICFFEGTPISVGRGTDRPFEWFGHPDLKDGDTTFIPYPGPYGIHFPQEGQECRGWWAARKLNVNAPPKKIQLQWLLRSYKSFADKSKFFNNFFNKLAGNSSFQQQIKDGLEEKVIRKSWEEKLNAYKTIRKKYLLYEDFE